MSLINQMLRDLDARESQRPQLSAVDSPAPVAARETKKPKSKRGLVLLIVIVCTLVGWFGFPQTQAWINKAVNVGGDIIQAIMAKVPKVAEQKPAENSPVEIIAKPQELTETVNIPKTRQIQRTEAVVVVENNSTVTPIAEMIPLRTPVVVEPVETVEALATTGLPELEKSVVETAVPLDGSLGANATSTVVAETLTKRNSQVPMAEKASPVRPPDVSVNTQVAVLAKLKVKSLRSDTATAVSESKVLNEPVKPAIKVKKRVKLTPSELAEQHYRRANSARTAGRYAESKKQLVSALGIDPGHSGARKLLAKLLMNSGSLDEAKNVISQGLQLTPTDPALIALEARIVMHQGDLKRAQGLLEDGLIHQSNNLELLALLGVLYQQGSDFDGALKIYQKLVSLQPGEGRNWAGLAISYDAISSGQKALQAYRQAVSLGGLPSEILSYTQTRITALKRSR